MNALTFAKDEKIGFYETSANLHYVVTSVKYALSYWLATLQHIPQCFDGNGAFYNTDRHLSTVFARDS